MKYNNNQNGWPSILDFHIPYVQALNQPLSLYECELVDNLARIDRKHLKKHNKNDISTKFPKNTRFYAFIPMGVNQYNTMYKTEHEK